jgi:hypothetical protein
MNPCITSKNLPKINLVIDAIMLIVLMLMAGLGFLIKYVLLPGYQRNAIYEGDVELYFMGLTRHDWGTIHLWLSLFFLFLMLVHIVLHWKMIVCIFRQMVSRKKNRRVLAVCLGCVALFFGLAPLFVKPEVADMPRNHIHVHDPGRFSIRSETPLPDPMPALDEKQATEEEILTAPKNENHVYEELELSGRMTLDEVAKKYSIPADQLTRALQIPSYQSRERIGRLRKQYGFEMEELKDAILALQ